VEGDLGMKDLIFAFMVNSGEAEPDAVRLARSIRTFGGEFCFNPIWMLTRQAEEDLSPATRGELFSLAVRLVSFEMDEAAASFPFASYVTAAAMAEALAQGETSCLVMMATDTLVLGPPTHLVLPAGKSLGACPVHLKLLGSGYREPLDEFWGMIYRTCQVDEEGVYPMQTIVDEQIVRPYFNAGLLAVRPERGLLRAWKSDFDELYRQPEFETYYRSNELYHIFMHQMVLAGSALSSLKPEEFQQLPFEMNYPLHLHSRVAELKRPANLNQLITCRYEDFDEVFHSPEAGSLPQIDQDLMDWLQSQ